MPSHHRASRCCSPRCSSSGSWVSHPINFPPENLPTWLADVHRLLPFYPMGVVIRDSLGVSNGENVAMAYAVITVWTLAALALTGWVLGRRK